MNTRLSTAQAAKLLGVSKRTVIRYAKKHNWDRTTTTDHQGRPVTSYDKSQILADYPAKGDTVTETPCLDADTVTDAATMTESGNLSPMTNTYDNDVAAMLLEAIEATTTNNRRNSRRICATIALCCILLGLVVLGVWSVHQEQEEARIKRIATVQSVRLYEEQRQAAAVIAAHDRHTAAIAAQAKAARDLARVQARQLMDMQTMKANETTHKNTFSGLVEWLSGE